MLFRSFFRLSPLLRPFLRPQPYYSFTSTSDPSSTQILEEVEAKIFQVLKSAAKCKTERLTRNATFEELGFDSLDSVELVVAMEENFGFDISNEEAEKIHNVNDAITLFNKYAVEKINKTNIVEKEETNVEKK